MATIRPPWMIQSAGRIDAKATPAKTGSQFIRENGGSLAPSYAGSFGGLNEFYRNQVAPTQHDRLQNQAQMEQQAGGGFYRGGGGATGEQFAAKNAQQQGAAVFARPATSISPQPTAQPLPAGLNRGSSGVLDTFNKYGSGFSVGGDKYAGGPSDNAAPVNSRADQIGVAAPVPAQKVGRKFAAAPQFVARGPRPANDAAANFPSAMGAQPVGRSAADRAESRFFRANPGAAIQQKNIDRQFGQNQAIYEENKAANEAASAGRLAMKVIAQQKADDIAKDRTNKTTFEHGLKTAEFNNKQDAVFNKIAETQQAETQKAGNLNKDLMNQQQRFAELYKQGNMGEDHGKRLSNLTDPVMLKSELDKHEANIATKQKEDTAAKKYADAQQYKQQRETRLSTMKPNELTKQSKDFTALAAAETDPERKALFQSIADEAATALAKHPETGNPQATGQPTATTADQSQTKALSAFFGK